NLRTLRRKAMNGSGELQPFGRADRCAADAAERHGYHLGERGDFGNARNDVLDRELAAEVGIVEHVQAVLAERGDRTPAADGGDDRFACHASPESVQAARASSFLRIMSPARTGS